MSMHFPLFPVFASPSLASSASLAGADADDAVDAGDVAQEMLGCKRPPPSQLCIFSFGRGGELVLNDPLASFCKSDMRSLLWKACALPPLQFLQVREGLKRTTKPSQ